MILNFLMMGSFEDFDNGRIPVLCVRAVVLFFCMLAQKVCSAHGDQKL